MELHIVVGKDGFVREQDGRQSFDAVVADIISGQFEDAKTVLRLTIPSKNWPHSKDIEDVTSKVAWAIYNKCDGYHTYVAYNSPAYSMIEQHVGIAQARMCLEQDAEEAA